MAEGDRSPSSSQPPSAGSPPPPPPPRSIRWNRVGPLAAFVLLLLAVNWWTASRVTREAPRVRIPYSPIFLNQVRTGNVATITSRGTTIQGSFVRKVRYPSDDRTARATTRFKTEIPSFANGDALSALLQRQGVVINAEPLESPTPWWQALIFGFGPTLLLVGLFVLLIRRTTRGGMLGGFGRSQARRYQLTGEAITFADVAGIDEAKAELSEVVDFLRNPEKYRRLGGRIPRGVLLSGPPGTGKTLLARAVAGEAGAPFYSMAASEFVEAIVGVGASRVRDLFARAKATAPAIVFIDELDAIGRARTARAGGFGGSDEREQTLNQILTEMDGFDARTNVIVLAATNRPDVLDPALLRPGRFDRRVVVQPPDRDGRERILEVHTRGVRLASDVDLRRIASSTPGMVGADLANLVNEAALLAARRGRDAVRAEDFGDALEKVVLGAERKVMVGPEDRRRTAYHEAGHAIVGMLTPGADPVRKVSIIPRGMALGITFSAPDADRFNYEERYLRARIMMALGGRAAEEIVLGDRTTGAESDIQQVTQIARQMVGRWGMSPAIGPVAVLPSEAQSPLLPGAEETSEATRRLVDVEVQRLVEESYANVMDLLNENREKLDALVDALLERETLDESEAYSVAGVERRAPEEPVGQEIVPA